VKREEGRERDVERFLGWDDSADAPLLSAALESGGKPPHSRRGGLVVIVCSSIYTGGVARFVTKRRSAIFGILVFERITRKKNFIFLDFFDFGRCAFCRAEGEWGD
jgi:hypothetical protein